MLLTSGFLALILTPFQIIVTVALLVLVIIIVILFAKLSTNKREMREELHKRLQQSIKDNAESQAVAIRQSAKVIQQRLSVAEHENKELQRVLLESQDAIKTCKQSIVRLENQVQELSQRDPEVRLYQQAKQLIAAGTSIDEVVESCGIPRAEAELLFSLADKKPSA